MVQITEFVVGKELIVSCPLTDCEGNNENLTCADEVDGATLRELIGVKAHGYPVLICKGYRQRTETEELPR